MAKRANERTQYRLSAIPEHNLICALGNPTVLRQLGSLEGAEQGQHERLGPFIAFRATRHSMMAAEAMAAPVFIAPEYNDLRRTIMSVPSHEMQVWREHAPAFHRPLMRHQEEFCARAFEKHGMFNASEQGTGKTATAIALSSAWGYRFNVIVCPKSIMRQWQGEYHMTLADPDEMIVVPMDGVTVNQRAEFIPQFMELANRIVIIVNYDVLAKLAETIIDVAAMYPSAVVFDESWRIKDRATKVSKAATRIADKCARVLCLTGTPVGQGVGDLWAQVRAIEGKVPPAMESYREWCDSYEKVIWTIAGTKQIGCKDPVGMMRRLEPMFYRATKATCLDLPEKLPTRRILFNMEKSQENLYVKVEQDGEAALGDGSSLMGALSTSLRLQQIAGGFVFNPDGTYSEEEAGQPHDLRLRFIGSPKLDWLEEFARDQLLGDPTARFIVWCKFNSEVMHIRAKLAQILGKDRVVEVHGATKEDDLERWIESVNSKDPEGIQGMVAQIKKLAYGRNLQGVDINFYYSHTWSHVEKSQSGDRSHRFGRIGPVAYYELVMRGTIDEAVLKCTDGLQDMHERYAPDTSIGRQQ